MGDLDVYYVPEVGVALEYFGLISDPSTLETMALNPAYVFVTTDQKTLSYKELLQLLPDDKTIRELTKKEIASLTEDDLKLKLGDRKFFKVMDIIESFTKDDLNALLGHLTFIKTQIDTGLEDH